MFGTSQKDKKSVAVPVFWLPHNYFRADGGGGGGVRNTSLAHSNRVSDTMKAQVKAEDT
jgi:hypothetical protein